MEEIVVGGVIALSGKKTEKRENVRSAAGNEKKKKKEIVLS